MFDILVWILLAGGAVILGIFLPGYLILKIFPFANRLDPGDVAIFSFGIGLIALPLSIYWANELGVAINLQGVFIVIAILVLTMLASNALLFILKRRQFIQSRQDPNDGSSTSTDEVRVTGKRKVMVRFSLAWSRVDFLAPSMAQAS